MTIRYAVKTNAGTYYNFICQVEEFGIGSGCLYLDKRYAERVARHLVVGGKVEVYELTLKETYAPEPKTELPELDLFVE